MKYFLSRITYTIVVLIIFSFFQTVNGQTVIWQSTFNDRFEWVSGNDEGFFGVWEVGTTPPQGSAALPVIQSNSRDDGFALFDSDFQCTGSSVAHLTNVNPVDLEGQSNVILQFEQFYKRWYDSTFVYVSTDNFTWHKFAVNQNLQNDNKTPNSDLVILDISSVAANKPMVFIRFAYYSPESLGQYAGCGYCWMIDDVKLIAIDDAYFYPSITGIISPNSVVCKSGVRSKNNVLDKGICWSTNPQPTLINQHIPSGKGEGSITTEITGLTAGTKYYARFYLTTTKGTNYSDELIIATPKVIEIQADQPYTFCFPDCNTGEYPVDLEYFVGFKTKEPNNVLVARLKSHDLIVNDTLTIYQGNSIKANILSKTTSYDQPKFFIAPNGQIFVRFNSSKENTEKSKWSFELYSQPLTKYTINCDEAVNVSLPSPYNLKNYDDNLISVVQCSNADVSKCLSMQFDQFSLANGDELYIYDGLSQYSPLLSVYKGKTIPPAILTTQSNITLVFFSDESESSLGFSAKVECADKTRMAACGLITGTKYWNTDIVDVNCDIKIASGAKLIIAPGTTVIFNGKYKIDVKGALLAQGSGTDSIKFIARNPITGWGGIRFDNTSSFGDSSIIDHCVIKYANNTNINGGAIYAGSFSKLRISNSEISYNTGKYGGGLYIEYSNCVVHKCYLAYNRAVFGAGIFIGGSEAQIENNIFNSNYGEAIYGWESSSKIRNNSIFNHAKSNYSITEYKSKASYTQNFIQNCSRIEFNNSEVFFANNIVTNSAGVRLILDQGTSIINNTICNNITAENGGGLMIETVGVTTIENNILWGNKAKRGNQIFVQSSNYWLSIANNVIEAGKLGIRSNSELLFFSFDGNRNIDASPEFVNPTQGIGSGWLSKRDDWSLNPTSNCINSGSNLNIDSGTDCLGNNRIYGKQVDIGAIEFQGIKKVCGDVNNSIIWDSDTIILACDIEITEGGTLTIRPNTTVLLEGYTIEVKGRLISEGSDAAPVVITSTTRSGLINFISEAHNDSSRIEYTTITNIGNYDNGAIKINEYDKLRISNCLITDNLGGLNVMNSSAVIANNVISNNTNRGYNAAGLMCTNCNGLITGNQILHNTAELGTAGVTITAASPLFQKNTIAYNQSNNTAGICYISGAVRIQNNLICNNTGLNIVSSTSNQNIIANNIICNNTAIEVMYFENAYSLNLINNTLVNNNCTFVIETVGGNLNCYNNIIWGNSSPICDFQNSSDSFSSNNVEGGAQSITGSDAIKESYDQEDNIVANPLFVDPTSGFGVDYDALSADWTLQPASTCINRGLFNCSLQNMPANDYGGNNRIINRIDVGAYEFIEHQHTQFIIGDTIRTNTEWNTDTIHVVCNNIFVPNGITLTIAAGTVVIFHQYNTIQIVGTLIAEGTKEKPIVFTVADTTGFWNKSNNVDGSWLGLHFNSPPVQNNLSHLKYCIVEYTKRYIYLYSNCDASGCMQEAVMPVGGALNISNTSNLIIEDCVFKDNFASEAGGAIACYNSNPQIERCTFLNSESVSGGAIWLNFSSPIINECTLYKAKATNGGAIYCDNSSPNITNCKISNNFASQNGGAIYSINKSNPTIVNSILCNNEASGTGGGIYSETNFNLLNTNIVRNKATDGGGLYCNRNYFEMSNCVVWGNLATQYGNQYYYNYCEFISSNCIIPSAENDAYLQFNITGSTVPIQISSSILAVDPLFIAPTDSAGLYSNGLNADWHTSMYSQTVNAGNNAVQISKFPAEKDIENNFRIFEETAIDIGPYESKYDIAPIDTFALLKLYSTTNGANWVKKWDLENFWYLSWNMKQANWLGVTIVGGRVTELKLPNNNMIGFLPPEISELKFLQTLHLGNNKFDSIPFEIGGLMSLTIVNLRNAGLKGNIPSEISLLEQMVTIDLSNNQLTGSYPSSFQTKLALVEISNNNLDRIEHLYYTPQLYSALNNRLTFEDIAPSLNNFPSFNYSPQQPVNDTLHIELTEGQDTIITMSLPENDNLYRWIKDGNEITPLQATNSFTITNASVDDQGVYWCEAINPAVPDLIIKRNPVYVDVNLSLLKDSLALVALYNSTDGDYWKHSDNWLRGPLSTWYGITIDGKVSEIKLSDNDLLGKLPDELGDLEFLQYLDLSNNAIGGSIPAQLGDCNSLVYLNLSSNLFSNAIPESLGNLSLLQEFYAFDNLLDGTIPESLSQLNELNIINLSYNYLSGIMPAFTNPKLTIIDLRDNALEDLPALDKKKLKWLQLLSVSNNKLTFEDLLPNVNVAPTFIYSPQAPIGEEIDMVVYENQTVTFSLYPMGEATFFKWKVDFAVPMFSEQYIYSFTAETFLGGTYTCEITNPYLSNLVINMNPIHLEVLEYPFVNPIDSLALVAFYHAANGDNWTNNTNWLKGNVKSWYGINAQKGRIVSINIPKNNLTGYITDSISLLTNLESFDLNDNRLGGAIPQNINKLTLIQYINLSKNELTGIIPDVESMEKLSHLNLSINKLSGNLPAKLPLAMSELFLSNNRLNGSIPETYTGNTLYHIDLSNNELSGSMPVKLISDNVSQIALNNNNLSGTVNFGSNPYIGSIDLSNNKFTSINLDSVPDKYPYLSYLNLAYNQIADSLSARFLKLFPIVNTLALNSNNFFGAIPKELNDLTNLEVLNLSKNRFEGVFPQLQSPNIRTIDISNNRFTGIENLSLLSNLSYLVVNNNRLTFESIEPHVNILDFNYAPQAEVLSEEIHNILELASINFESSVGGSKNQYRWKKDGRYVTKLSSNATFTITSAKFDNSGEYICEITNPLAPDLMLVRRPVNLNVAIALTKPIVSQPEPYCIGDEKFILAVNDNNTEHTTWFGDAQLTDTLGFGKYLPFVMKGDYDTVYVANIAGVFKSEVAAVTIALRPSIIFEGGNLIATQVENAQYEWFYNNTAIGTGRTIPSRGDGQYYVRLNTGLCAATSRVAEIKNGKMAYVGIENFTNSAIGVKVYPNPANTELNVQLNFDLSGNVELILISSLGVKLRTLNIEKNEPTIVYNFDICNLPAGLYLLQVRTGNTQRAISFVKQ